MSVARVLLDEAPNQEDSQGCEHLLIPLGTIMRVCCMIQRWESARVEIMLGKLCLNYATVRQEARDLEILSQVEDEVRETGEEGYVYCLRALTRQERD
jgi:hypothetical protein